MKPKEIKAIKEELDIIPEELVTNVEKETKDFWNLFWKLREYAYNYSNSIMIKKIYQSIFIYGLKKEIIFQKKNTIC